MRSMIAAWQSLAKTGQECHWSVRQQPPQAGIRSDTVSVFDGPPPAIRVLGRESEEAKAVGAWMAERSRVGILPQEFGVFVRSAAQLARAQAALGEAGLLFKVLDEQVETTTGHVSISTIHWPRDGSSGLWW